MFLLAPALNTPSKSAQVVVRGCSINYATWGRSGNPGLLLIHGSNAHLEWWRIIAPELSKHFRVAAIDLSGNGNSGWREAYSGKIFAEEVMAVCSAANLGEKPYVAGHSFGGYVTLETGHLFSEELGGIVLIDFSIRPPQTKDDIADFQRQALLKPARPTRIYADREAILKRFRLVPEQSCKNTALLRYVAEQSIREVNGGWTWKFDPDLFRKLDVMSIQNSDPTAKLMMLKCPRAFVMGEQSLDYSPEALAYTRELTSGNIPMFSIPGTFHHLMFDDPVAMITALTNTLLMWETIKP
jgi:pimeloyl-ACP methyl ester carboxylesterase